MTASLPVCEPPNISNRRLVGVYAERITNVSSSEFPGHYPGEDHSWNLAKFAQNLRVEVTRLSQHSIEFDLVGVDASIANAIRRTLIADVPTICIENVYVFNNTSVIQDEVLAQRLGLVPLNVNPALFEYREETTKATDRNTLVFKLNVTCTRKAGAPEGTTTDVDLLYNDRYVTTGMLKWEPQGEQATLPHFKDKLPAPTNLNIVLAKLCPGQTIEMECHAIKGVGREHSKWSPVATASYRIHPHITLFKQPSPHLARKFADCFSPGVIHVIDEGTPNARVEINALKVRNDSVSREVLRHPEFEDCVQLGRVRDWFLFNVESEGPYTPETLVPAAIRVLRQRIAALRKAAEKLVSGEEEEKEEERREEEGVGEGEGHNGVREGDIVMTEF